MAFAGFTSREIQVIELRTQGMKPSAIAGKLGCTRRQIYNHTGRIYRKTGLTSLAQLTQWAVQYGLDESVDEQA